MHSIDLALTLVLSHSRYAARSTSSNGDLAFRNTDATAAASGGFARSSVFFVAHFLFARCHTTTFKNRCSTSKLEGVEMNHLELGHEFTHFGKELNVNNVWEVQVGSGLQR